MSNITTNIYKESASTISVTAAGAISFLNSVDCTNELTTSLPIPEILSITIPEPSSQPVKKLILNSKEFYNNFINRLDLQKLLTNPHEQLPSLGEDFKRKKELLQEHVERYEYNPSNVRAFVQDLLKRYLTLFNNDFDLLMSHYKHLAYELYAKTKQINLLESKFNCILNLVNQPQLTFNVEELVKYVTLAAFFNLRKIFYIFFH